MKFLNNPILVLLNLTTPPPLRPQSHPIFFVGGGGGLLKIVRNDEYTKALTFSYQNNWSTGDICFKSDFWFQTMGAGADAKKPVANVSLMSIGRLGLAENKKHSGQYLP